jgi:hypothetical protein
MVQRITVLLFALFLYSNATKCESILPVKEAYLIKEAKKISQELGDKLWPGTGKIPFAIILVTNSTEFLMYHPYPSNDFAPAGNDTILKTPVYKRPRIYNKEWLATFPAVNGVNCIVVGTVANTGRSETDWMITLLHENFHQFVYSSPGYYDAVKKLNLSGGDETGMWMLNYPFPYDSMPVIKQYEKYSTALANAVKAVNKKTFKQQYRLFKKEKNKFKKILRPDDYSYFSFQLWQEGLAKYTEYKFLELLASYQMSTEILNMTGFTPIKTYTKEFYDNELKNLQILQLSAEKRICIYAVGFAEGLLLDVINKKWRRHYLVQKFSTDSFYK